MGGRKYLNLDIAFHRHPKTRRLVGLLGRGAETILTRLWCHCGEHHCETGEFTGYSEQEIETIVEWWGKPGACVEALLRLGLLEKTESGYRIHDWFEHCGHLAMLSRRGKKNAEKRWKPPPNDTESDASSIPPGTAPTLPLPSLSLKEKEENTFAHFWSIYPRKVGRKKAEEKWWKLNLSPETIKTIFADVERRKRSPEWLKEGGQFIPYPATYLHGERWTDEVPINGPGQAGGHLGSGRVAVTKEALDRQEERRHEQAARDLLDDAEETPPADEPGAGAN